MTCFEFGFGRGGPPRKKEKKKRKDLKRQKRNKKTKFSETYLRTGERGEGSPMHCCFLFFVADSTSQWNSQWNKKKGRPGWWVEHISCKEVWRNFRVADFYLIKRSRRLVQSLHVVHVCMSYKDILPVCSPAPVSDNRADWSRPPGASLCKSFCESWLFVRACYLQKFLHLNACCV